MIVTVRLEADGTTLDEVVKDIDNATKALKLSKDMHIHDEHYERVHESCYKGRRVFKTGVPSRPVNPYFYGTALSSSGNAAYQQAQIQAQLNVNSTQQIPVPKHKAPHPKPR